MAPKRIRYGKLVRDGIPGIISRDGARAKVRRLSRSAYSRALREKLCEEARELRGARGSKAVLNELIDIQELVEAGRRLLGVPPARFRKMVEKKRKTRGAFRKRLYLEYTEE